MEQISENPYDNKPCNYISYGDYCNHDTCWCAKSMQWKRENGPVSLVDEMKMLQNRANIRTEEYYKLQEDDSKSNH